MSIERFRKELRSLYYELSDAGNPSSRFRREHLLSIAIWEALEETQYQVALKKIRETSKTWDFEGYEDAVRQIHKDLKKHGDVMVLMDGRTQSWGGSRNIEFLLLATIMGAAIEVWHACLENSSENVVITDERNRQYFARLEGTFVPEDVYLPCKLNDYSVVVPHNDPYKSRLKHIRLFVQNSHYQLLLKVKESPKDVLSEAIQCGDAVKTIPVPNNTPHLVKPYSSIDSIRFDALCRALKAARDVDPNPYCKAGSVDIRYETLCRLMGRTYDGKWLSGSGLYLNDDVIAACFALYQKRHDDLHAKQNSVSVKSGLRRVLFMDPIFSKHLLSSKRRTQFKNYEDLNSHISPKEFRNRDIILLPIAENLHWFLGVVDINLRSVAVYDSLNIPRARHAEEIKLWAENCFNRAVSGDGLDHDGECWQARGNLTSSTTLRIYSTSQDNGYDCGVFVCKAAEAISFCSPLSFNNEDSHFVRFRMAEELISGTATGLHETREISFIRPF